MQVTASTTTAALRQPAPQAPSSCKQAKPPSAAPACCGLLLLKTHFSAILLVFLTLAMLHQACSSLMTHKVCYRPAAVQNTLLALWLELCWCTSLLTAVVVLTAV